jgi:hypothetical protein
MIDASNYPTKVVAFDKSKTAGNPYVRSYMASDNLKQYDSFGARVPKPLADTPSCIESIIVDEGLNIDAEMKARTSWKAPFTAIRVAVPCPPLPTLAIGDTAAMVNASVGVTAPEHAFVYGTHLMYGLYHEIDAERGQFGTTVFLERRGVSTP